MSDFPSMHADDAARLPHVSLDELSARILREPTLMSALKRAHVYDPAKGPMQTEGKGRRSGMSTEEKKEYQRDYQRARRTLLTHSKGSARAGAGRPRKETS